MNKHKKDEKHELTIKQKKFVDEYIKTGQKKQAAINAGYSAKYADRQANQTLKLDYVQDYLHEQLDKLHAKNIADTAEILTFFSKMMRGEITEQVVAPNSSVLELRANNNERLAAGKELIKRVPTDMVKAQMRKLEAETKLTDAKTKMLTNTDTSAEDELSSLIDKMDAIARADKDDDKHGQK
ncbi:terminase small subunit [Lactobacillus kitasatonis]|uniref:terminase small subunit n=1 Tax=Lactobacillus kitasatonis TaxID=237446 RepID=UPI003F67ABEF